MENKGRRAYAGWEEGAGSTGCVSTLVLHPASQTKKPKEGSFQDSRTWGGDGMGKHQSCCNSLVTRWDRH